MLLLMVFASDVQATSVTDKMTDAVKSFDLPSAGEGSNAEATLLQVVGRLIGAFLSLLGIVFFGLMLYGGWKWMMAAGKDDEINSAKAIIRSAIIGLSIIISAYAITYFVTNALQASVQ